MRLDVWIFAGLFALLGIAVIVLLGRLVIGQGHTRTMATALARRAQILEVIIETAPAGFVIFDRDARIVRMNPALADTIGVDPAQHHGEAVDVVFGDDVGPPIRRAVTEVFDEGRAIAGQRLTLPTRHEPRTVLVSYFPVELDDYRLVGAVVVDVTARERYDSERERLLTAETAARAAAERVASRMMRLQGITASLSTAKSSSLVAEVIMAEGMNALEVDSGNLATLRDDLRTLQIVATDGWDRTLQHESAFSIDAHNPLADAARTQVGVYLESLDDLVARYPHLADEARRSERRSWAALPLVVSGRTLGAIGAAFSDDRPFDSDRVAFLEAVAGQCAAAFDRALTYDTARVMASTLQRSLLPPALPETKLVDFSAHFESAGSGEVSGDFYDVFAMSDDQSWCATIGDVCGKGPRAAAMTSLARHTVRAAARHDSRPSTVLAELGEALRRDAAQRDLQVDESFATAAFVKVQRRDRRLHVEIASGGHPLPLLVRSGTGRDAVGVRELGKPGTLLGVLDRPDVRLYDEAIDLDPGDALVLYTDGLSEARGPQGFFGDERILQAVSRPAASASELVASVVGSAMDFSDGILRDDLAVLVIRAPSHPRVYPEPQRGNARAEGLLTDVNTTSTASERPEVIITLPPLTTSTSTARTAVESSLRSIGCDDDTSERVVAVTSELVANAVVHAHSQTEIALGTGPSGIRIEVRDLSDALPVLTEPDNQALEDYGRGLIMVREFSDEWGVDALDGGKVVWAEFRTRN